MRVVPKHQGNACRLWRLCLVAGLLATRPGAAAQVSVPVEPATARIGLTVFAVGLWPVQGQFERFRGQLVVDPAKAGECRISVAVEVASLRMAGPERTRLALGPSLLDATRYPRLAYDGTCSASAAAGQLTLHGATRRLTLVPHRAGDLVSATGSLHRSDFGITGLPGLVGRRVDLLLSVTLPPGLAEQLAAQPAGSNFSAAPFMQ